MDGIILNSMDITFDGMLISDLKFSTSRDFSGFCEFFHGIFLPLSQEII